VRQFNSIRTAVSSNSWQFAVLNTICQQYFNYLMTVQQPEPVPG